MVYHKRALCIALLLETEWNWHTDAFHQSISTYVHLSWSSHSDVLMTNKCKSSFPERCSISSINVKLAVNHFEMTSVTDFKQLSCASHCIYSTSLCWGKSVSPLVLQTSLTPPTLSPVHHHLLRWSNLHWEGKTTITTMNPMVFHTSTRKRCLSGHSFCHLYRSPSTCTTWNTCRGLCFESCFTWRWYSLV